jgi:hypothetical protein
MKRFVSAALAASTRCSVMCPHDVFGDPQMLFAARDWPAENEPLEPSRFVQLHQCSQYRDDADSASNIPMQRPADRAPVTGRKLDLIPHQLCTSRHPPPSLEPFSEPTQALSLHPNSLDESKRYDILTTLTHIAHAFILAPATSNLQQPKSAQLATLSVHSVHYNISVLSLR